MTVFDAIIIGTGQAGPSLARRLAAAGQTVAIIERGNFGGTCVNTGCTPTKTLVAMAYAAHMARRASDFGVRITGNISVDMRAVKARKDYVSSLSSRGVERSLKTLERCRVIEGHARFVDNHAVTVGEETLQADQIFINVGARAQVPPIPGLNHVNYLTNSSILDIDFLPPHLVVLGGSYIGLEFAQVYRRFGSRVTVIESATRLVPREDEDVSSVLADILRNEGIDIRVGARALRVWYQDSEIVIEVEQGGGKSLLMGSHLLVATGRRPNTDDLGLENTDILTDARGFITVDDQLRTNAPDVWALGDCNGRGGFTHTAYNDFEIVADNILGNRGRRLSDRITGYALYTDPPLGRAGMTETEVRKSGRPALMATMAMEDVSRAFEKGETQGFMKILVDKETQELLGASFLGLSGDEIANSVLDLMYAKTPYTVVQNAVHIHPTVSELIPTMLGDLRELR